MLRHVHVVGAGLAGLNAALHLVDAGITVTLHEAAKRAGGRCRSYPDPVLGLEIDNGNHLMLSGNSDIRAFLARSDASANWWGPDRAEIPFLDLPSGARWSFQPGPGCSPLWLFDAKRRAPGTSLWDYLKALRLSKAGRTVAEAVGESGPAFRAFWEPLCLGVLNAKPAEAEARLLWNVLAETVAKGEPACRPRFAKGPLGPALIEPAVAALTKAGADIRFGDRLRGLDRDERRITHLSFSGGDIDLGADEALLLALPAPVAADLLEEPAFPVETRAIVNLHFRPPEPLSAPAILGLVGATAQWLFCKGEVASVTISAADDLAERDAQAIIDLVRPEVAAALGRDDAAHWPCQVVKEKRATFAQTAAQIRLRPPPGPMPGRANLLLAGDWTDTGLPATIEGALRSGRLAVNAALRKNGIARG